MKHLRETEAMEFVRQNTSILAPKVFLAFTYRGSSYIVMEKIQGISLHDVLVEGPSAKLKTTLLRQLKEMINELRSIEPPHSFSIGDVNGTPDRHPRLSNPHYRGPYLTMKTFRLDFRNGIDASNTGYIPGLAEFVPVQDRASSKLVFTHGDLSSDNIIGHGD
ncbi:hypothetical protein K470DRAFT_56267 [Piedraia hortae CBS 480.64]|uniref:Aminoglycoside phosphotransferase domain-containing protein n=1 Tax=Piedraia hortae CBS 480.64 TaxID=1314780 RepID=A0A6A7C0S2_9PEZI|nr:hypothetical protein K470DRAFT_56267 [Piedraia hortae CBS 480.64]